MLGKLYALVGGVCAEDNPDALTHQELLLPGHLLMKFLREKLEDCLAVFKDLVRRDLDKSPGAVNLQVRTDEHCNSLELTQRLSRCNEIWRGHRTAFWLS